MSTSSIYVQMYMYIQKKKLREPGDEATCTCNIWHTLSLHTCTCMHMYQACDGLSEVRFSVEGVLNNLLGLVYC